MPQYLFQLGSHPKLSLKELETVLGLSSLPSPSDGWLRLDLDEALPDGFIDRLGGTVRIAEVIETAPGAFDVVSVAQYLVDIGVTGKAAVGVWSKRLGIGLKKAMRERGVKISFIMPTQGKYLSAMAVLKNDLTDLPNVDLLQLKLGSEHVLARTVQVQDVVAYTYRDDNRPRRDAVVGMLPPRLAQIMLNLAARGRGGLSVWDPFCGLGTVLQEGWILGHRMTGSDVSKEMIVASQENLEYLQSKFDADQALSPEVSSHDATTPYSGKFDAIVTEVILGEPLSSPPPPAEAQAHLAGLQDLYLKFFEEVRHSLTDGGNVVVALPMVRSEKGKWVRLSPTLLDEISSFGYSKEDLSGTERGSLEYSRDRAVVGRELFLFRAT